MGWARSFAEPWELDTSLCGQRYVLNTLRFEEPNVISRTFERRCFGCSHGGYERDMTNQSSNPDATSGTNTGPVDPDVRERAERASTTDPDGARRDDGEDDGTVDPDAPARGVLFPDEDAPEPNEPG
jgi:hypothetical protein